MAVQSLLIRFVLSPLGTIMDKLPEKIKNAMFLAGGIGLVVMNFLQNAGVLQVRYLIFFVICCVFLGMMILASLKKEMEPVKFNKWLACFWFGAGILILISGIRNNVDYLPGAAMMLVAFPILYIGWTNAERDRIFGLLLSVNRLAGWLFVGASFLLIPIVRNRYAGIFVNTNSAAYCLSVIFAGLLVNVIYTRKFGWKMGLDILLLGIVAALNYYTASRTGTLAIYVASFFGVSLYLLTHKLKDNLACLAKTAAVMTAATLCISGLVYVFQLRQAIPVPFYDLEEKTFYMNYRGLDNLLAKPTEPNTDASTKPTGEPVTDSTTKPTQGMFDNSSFKDMTDKKNDTTDKSLDKLSTGRLTVWRLYATQLNLFGHESVPPVYVDSLHRDISTTHMTALQIGYESGIIAGVLYLLFNLGTGVVTILFAWRYRSEQYAIFPLVVTAAFGVLSMLGSCSVVFWHYTTLMYYLVQFPIMTRENHDAKMKG